MSHEELSSEHFQLEQIVSELRQCVAVLGRKSEITLDIIGALERGDVEAAKGMGMEMDKVPKEVLSILSKFGLAVTYEQGWRRMRPLVSEDK